jgi:hypothetical protein
MPVAVQQVGAWLMFFGLISGVGGCSTHSLMGQGAVVGICGWIAVVAGAVLFGFGLLLGSMRKD